LEALKTEGLQTRDGLSLAVVKEYAELMGSGKKLPPLSVTRNAAGDLFLTDGYHRVAAMRRLKRTMADAEITEGEYIDAVRAALQANVGHGLRRSNADKKNALAMAWKNRIALFGGDPSHEMLAEACAVTRRTAQRFRDKVSTMDNVHSSTRLGVNGKTYRAAGDVSPYQASVSNGVGGDFQAPRVDRFGTPVPERLVGAFESARYGEAIKAARQLKAAIVAAMDEGDYGFSKVSQSTLITLDNLIADLKAETPYCVCPQCGGRGCRACNDVGLQTKMEYERNPKEIRAHA